MLKPRASSAVPFEEDDRDPTIWFLDHSYLENMFDMYKRVNGNVPSSSLALMRIPPRHFMPTTCDGVSICFPRCCPDIRSMR
jgi:hypothetical protein